MLRRFVLFALCLASLTASADNAILVLDESGSMWAQLQGKTRIEIARSVIGDMLKQVPADRQLGLVAYGHRREGDCNDIEEVVPVGADRAAILARVNAMKPKGKTPLTDGVRFAAQQLRYTEGKATVILLSDGAESCNKDPCALARELEAAGVDFTVHVVGFALQSETESAGLRCLAEATGGRYFAASDARQLSEALVATVAAPLPKPPAAAPTTAHVVLRATELDGGPEITSGLSWQIAAAGAEPVFHADNVGATEATIAPGEYVAQVQRGDGSKGSAALKLLPGAERTVTIPLELVLEASLVAAPADSAQAGAKISVQWTGPNRDGDYVTVVEKGAVPTAYNSYVYTKKSNPATLTLPAFAGDYELRYVLGRPTRILAAVPYTVAAASAAIEAPAEVSAGSPFPITWTGPNADGDWLTIIEPGAVAHAYASYVDADRPGPAKLTAPLTPGNYEVRYVAGGENVLARAPVVVAAVTANIEAPESVVAGAQFDISWQGPNNAGDWLTIVQPDAVAHAYGSYVDAPKGSPAKLTAPTVPGDYQLRYVQDGKLVLAQRTIRVSPAQ